MRKQVFEKLTTLPVGYFDTHATGDIISHLSYDIDTINSTLSHDLIQVMTSLYTVIGSLIFMWQISKPMILIFALTVPVSILVTRYRSKVVRPLFRQRAKKYGSFEITRGQSLIYIKPLDDFADIDGMFDAAMKTFGIAAIGRAAVCEKDVEDIKRVAREYIPNAQLRGID